MYIDLRKTLPFIIWAWWWPWWLFIWFNCW